MSFQNKGRIKTAMKKQTFPAESFEGFSEQFKAAKIPHEMIATNATIELIANGQNLLFTNSGIAIKDLQFIKKVKAEIIHSAKKNRLPRKNPGFFKLIDLGDEIEVIRDVIEIDLTAAFWTTAAAERLISNETYLEGLDRDKNVRLVAFGSAAVSKRYFKYDIEAAEYEFIKEEFIEYGRRAYFYVSWKVGEMVKRLFDVAAFGDIFVFWVDAVIIKKKYAEYVARYFNENGYNSKRKEIRWLRYEKRGSVLTYSALEIGVTDSEKTTIRIKTFTAAKKIKRREMSASEAREIIFSRSDF